jgi:ribosomal protein S18 acetylase RimI-like enzyme
MSEMPNEQCAAELEIRTLTRNEFVEAQSLHFEHVFKNRAHDTENQKSLQPNAISTGRTRRSAPKSDHGYVLYLGLYLGNELVGWHVGAEVDHETYQMQNSAILERYRSKGFYSHFVTRLLEKLCEDGFEVVTGYHHPNNAAVIIPKLRAGFVISGMQFHERFRFLIEMRYYFDPDRRKAFGRRMGLDL